MQTTTDRATPSAERASPRRRLRPGRVMAPALVLVAAAGLALGFSALTAGASGESTGSVLHTSFAHEVSAASAPQEPLTSETRESISFARSLSTAFRHAAEVIEPSVVHITTAELVRPRAIDPLGRRRIGEPQLMQTGLGSGVIIDERGYIVTNNHVIADADRLEVRLADGREVVASLIGRDPETDVAVLKIDAPDLTPAHFADPQELGVGEWVLAAGSPFGLDQTITAGIVSAVGRPGIGDRDVTDGPNYQEFIQTDASINPGNSGGPLVNLEGHIVGINTAIFGKSNSGIGFAIPADIVRPILETIMSEGRVVRGFLGVGGEAISADEARTMGVAGGTRLRAVVPGGPADIGGLREGDIVLAINGRPTETRDRMSTAIGLVRPGASATVEIIRDGEHRTLKMKVGDRDTQLASASGAQFDLTLGAAVRPIDIELRDRRGRMQPLTALAVVSVAPGSRGDTAGLETGDIILSVDGDDVESAEDLADELERADFNDGVRIEIIRGRVRGYVEVFDR